VPTAAFGTTVGDPGDTFHDGRAFVDATYTRHRGALTYTGRLAADVYRYHGEYPYRFPAAGGVGVDRVVSTDEGRSRWLSAEGRVHWHADDLGEHVRDVELIGGADATVVPFGLQQVDEGMGGPLALDRADRAAQLGVYSEGSARVAERVVVTAGLRGAWHESFGATVHPRAAVMFDGRGLGRLRASAGTAYRAPSLYERYYWAGQGDHPLGPERSATVELSGERYLGERVRLQLTGYHQRFTDLIVLETVGDGDHAFGNVGRASGHGVEVELEGKWSAITGRARYAWQHTRGGDGERLVNSPSSLFGGSALVPVAGGRAILGLETSYVGRRLAGDGGSVAPWFLSSATLTVPHLRGPVGGSLGVTNLFDAAVADPGSEDDRVTAIPGDPRTVWLRVGVGL
jgi:iron complex outermembrane receptor protein